MARLNNLSYRCEWFWILGTFLLVLYPSFSTSPALSHSYSAKKYLSKMRISQFEPLRLMCNITDQILEKIVIVLQVGLWVHSLSLLRWLVTLCNNLPLPKTGIGIFPFLTSVSRGKLLWYFVGIHKHSTTHLKPSVFLGTVFVQGCRLHSI